MHVRVCGRVWACVCVVCVKAVASLANSLSIGLVIERSQVQCSPGAFVVSLSKKFINIAPVYCLPSCSY